MKYIFGIKGWIGQKLKPILSCRAIASHRAGEILLIDDPLARMNKVSLRLTVRRSKSRKRRIPSWRRQYSSFLSSVRRYFR